MMPMDELESFYIRELEEVRDAYRAFYKGVIEKDNQAVEKAFRRLTELGE